MGTSAVSMLKHYTEFLFLRFLMARDIVSDFFQFQEAMKQMNEIRKYNYEKANGLIEPWDCDVEGDPEDE